MHTWLSDGALPPAAVADLAVQAGLTHIAVTDHDTLAGSDALRAAQTGLRVIPGVELSMRERPELHLLAYGLTPGAGLRSRLNVLARKREERAWEMIRRLRALGRDITEEQVRAHSRGSIGRPHLARALVAAGCAGTVQEAFDRWLGEGRPAWVPCERMDMGEALRLLRAEGWIGVLAHPRTLALPDSLLESLLREWKEQGLAGVEVYHPSAAGGAGFVPLDRMVRRLGLLVTGGSDFHAEADDRHGRPGCMTARWEEAEEDMKALLQRMEERRTETGIPGRT